MKISIKFCLFVTVLTTCWLQSVSKQCSKRFHLCGEKSCCCRRDMAVCRKSNLTYIPRFSKEPGMNKLFFMENTIQNLSGETFHNISVPNLKVLYLDTDGIINVGNETFEKFAKLRKLCLQNNDKLNWSQMELALHNIPYSLNRLRLQNTGLRNLHDSVFSGLRQKNVTDLNLGKNFIEVFNERAFLPMKSLERLDLRENRIKEISVSRNQPRLGHPSIKYLNLAYNRFMYYTPSFCNANSSVSPYPKLKTLDLRGNAIMVLNRNAWFCLKRLKKLVLRENVIETLGDDTFVDLQSLESLHVSYNAKPIQSIAERAFHNSHLKELHFENNNIDFKPNSDVPYDKLFTFCPNLTNLLIGHNYFRSIYNTKLITMLSPLTKLTELHIDLARLYEMPVGLFSKFPNLKRLYMGHNKLERINSEAFNNVTKLNTLHLDANKIKVISQDSLPPAVLNSLKEINLGGNPFSCSFCSPNNNTWFRNWIESSRKANINIVQWPSYYKCASPPSALGTCFASHKPKYEDCLGADPMIVAYASIGSFLVIFSVLGLVGYRGRWYIRYWTIKWQRRCGCVAKVDPERQRLLGNDNERNALYDAYVIYHDDDRAFVRGEIIPFMETQHKYRLFIWDRDFTAGDQTVGIVVDNIYKSNHVIAVVSKSFLKDQWCDFQLAVCLDREIELKRKFHTLLTLENVDRKLLSKSWCVLLTKAVTAEWCARTNDIRRKLFENQILSNVPCMANKHIVNDDEDG